MKLLLDTQRRAMLANGKWNEARKPDTDDFKPVVKLFVPWGSGTWLLTELDPEEPDIAFGLCDPGLGSPELGSVRLTEIESIRGPGGLKIERDMHFTASKTLSEYTAEARSKGRIVA